MNYDRPNFAGSVGGNYRWTYEMLSHLFKIVNFIEMVVTVNVMYGDNRKLFQSEHLFRDCKYTNKIEEHD